MHSLLIIIALSAGILSTGCLHEPIHQGNRLDGNAIYLIKEGDSKFTIEQRLGTPALNNTLHPNRVTYYEEFEDEESGKLLWRSIEIIYDSALRATKITYAGFDNNK